MIHPSKRTLIVVHPTGEVEEVAVPFDHKRTFDKMKEIVGGYLQLLYLTVQQPVPRIALVVDEEGLVRLPKLPMNRKIHGMAGTVVICSEEKAMVRKEEENVLYGLTVKQVMEVHKALDSMGAALSEDEAERLRPPSIKHWKVRRSISR